MGSGGEYLEVAEASDGWRAGLSDFDPVDEKDSDARGIAVHRRSGGDNGIGSADLVRGHLGDVVDRARADGDE